MGTTGEGAYGWPCIGSNGNKLSFGSHRRGVQCVKYLKFHTQTSVNERTVGHYL